jgi:hypothetical protein
MLTNNLTCEMRTSKPNEAAQQATLEEEAVREVFDDEAHAIRVMRRLALQKFRQQQQPEHVASTDAPIQSSHAGMQICMLLLLLSLLLLLLTLTLRRKKAPQVPVTPPQVPVQPPQVPVQPPQVPVTPPQVPVQPPQIPVQPPQVPVPPPDSSRRFSRVTGQALRARRFATPGPAARGVLSVDPTAIGKKPLAARPVFSQSDSGWVSDVSSNSAGDYGDSDIDYDYDDVFECTAEDDGKATNTSKAAEDDGKATNTSKAAEDDGEATNTSKAAEDDGKATTTSKALVRMDRVTTGKALDRVHRWQI